MTPRNYEQYVYYRKLAEVLEAEMQGTKRALRVKAAGWRKHGWHQAASEVEALADLLEPRKAYDAAAKARTEARGGGGAQ